MSLKVLEAQTGENPVATIIIMHGLGADGRDFFPIAKELDLSAIGPVRFLFPNAPRDSRHHQRWLPDAGLV